MKKAIKYQVVISMMLLLSGCGLLPAAGLLVDDQSPSLFLVKSDNYQKITKILSKKITLAGKPELADYMVYIMASPVSVVVDIIDKNGQAQELNYQPVTGNISRLVASGILQAIRIMPQHQHSPYKISKKIAI